MLYLLLTNVDIMSDSTKWRELGLRIPSGNRGPLARNALWELHVTSKLLLRYATEIWGVCCPRRNHFPN